MKEGKTKEPEERYLKLPNHILNLRSIGLSEKVLLAHFYSFGEKGCWQSNETLAEAFMVDERTIQRWFATIVKAGLVQVKCPKGRYRTIWVKSHPAVRAAAQLWYRGKAVSNRVNQVRQNCRTTNSSKGAEGEQVRQNCRGKYDKNGFQVRQNCRTTKNTTIRETITPPPLPAHGQAAALLSDREQESRRQLQRFKEQIANKGKPKQRLSAADFEAKRQEAKKRLYESTIENGSGGGKKGCGGSEDFPSTQVGVGVAAGGGATASEAVVNRRVKL
ncbi:MAG TPA: helix-turn-helix domain-containing protein [Sedimentisphaerales bacterium]|nr:helix-turn-helix domain-containing protein [Sedimentisphaerales bacterium]